MRSNIANSGNAVWLLEFEDSTGMIWFYQRYAGEGSSGSLANLIAIIGQRVIVSGGTSEGARMRDLGSGTMPPPGDTGWRKLAIAFFNGDLDVWVDDTLVIGVTDQYAVQEGDLALENVPGEGKTFYDNMVLCSLNEPYAPPAE